MRRLFGLIIVLWIAGVSLWLIKNQDLPATQTNKTPAPGKETRQYPSIATSLRHKTSSVTARALDSSHSSTKNNQNGTPPYARKPEGTLVEFQVIDGLAVTHGDILLGKPDEAVPGGRGLTEAPVPEFWNHPDIPYLIHPDLPNPQRVEKALAYLKQKTALNFIPHQGQTDAIIFEPGSEHCLSPLGKIGGLQPIRLAPGCGTQQVLHEILHSLGFIHEQGRPDRDQFIEILWNNIDEKFHAQFAIFPEALAQPLHGTPFDYQSIMMYRTDTFAKTGDSMTMRSLSNHSIDPVTSGLSDMDISRLNQMFRGYE